MTLATRLTAIAAPALAADNSEWILFITDLSDTTTDGTELGIWWATPGATDADKDLIVYTPVNGDPSSFAASWVPQGIMQLDGDTLTGVLVDVVYSDSVATVADLTGTEVDTGGSVFADSFDDGLIGLPVKSFDETMIESGFAKRFDQLADVAATGDDAPTDGQAPVWDDARGRWVPGTVSGSGGGLAGVDLASETAGVSDAATVIAGGKAAVNSVLTSTLTSIKLPALPTTSTGSGFTLYLTPALLSPGSLDDVSFTVDGGGTAVVVGSVALGDGSYVWRVEPRRILDDSFQWVLLPMVAASYPVDAERYDLTGETPGDLTLDMSAHPVGKAAAVVLMPAGSGQTLEITTPAGALYGHIDVTVIVTGSVTVWAAGNTDLITVSAAISGGGAEFVFADLKNEGDLGPMVLVPSGFNVTGGGASVVSVNGETGIVTLDAADVGAVPTSRQLAGLDLTVNRTASTLRTALSLDPGTDVQAHDALLDGLTSLSGSLVSGGMLYATGPGALAQTPATTSYGRTLLLKADATEVRAYIGLVLGTDVQAYHANLAALAGLSLVADRLPYANGTGTLALATFTSFGRSLVDDADATTARTTLGVAIGTNVQAWDADLDALAGVTSAADALPYFTGSHTATTTTLTTFGRSLIDDTDATTARATLGLTIGTNVQAQDAELSALAGLTSAADKVPYFTGSGSAATADLTTFGRSLIDDADAATARTTLGAAASADSALQRKTGDQTINNTTTLADITDLVSPTQAISTAWKYEWTIFHGGVATTTAGIDFAVTVPTGATVIADSFGPRTGTTPFLLQTNNAATASATRLPHGNGGSGSPVLMTKVTAIVITDGTHSGTVALQFSQTTATGSNTTVFTNSVLDAKRIS